MLILQFFFQIMRFLDVDLSDGKLCICGSQNILSDLGLHLQNHTVHSFRDCSRIVISSFNSNVSLDLIFLDVYTRASNLSGTVIEKSSSPISRRILWSFPARKPLMYKLWHSTGVPLLLKSFFLAYAVRLLSAQILSLDIWVLSLCFVILLYILTLLSKPFSRRS